MPPLPQLLLLGSRGWLRREAAAVAGNQVSQLPVLKALCVPEDLVKPPENPAAPPEAAPALSLEDCFPWRGYTAKRVLQQLRRG